MTRDEIDKLEAGPETDALVAERVMGVAWREVRVRGSTNGVRILTENPYYSDGQCTEAELRAVKCREYSLEVAAAWGLLEHLEEAAAEEGRYWRIETPDPRVFGDIGTHYCVWLMQTSADHEASVLSAHAPIMPLAVCRAALIWSLTKDAP